MAAGTAAQLIAWRGLMGAGPALIMSATLSIVATVFSPDQRPKAIAIWAGFAGAGGVIGLVSSGLLLRAFWWGSVFAVNLPIVVVMLIAVALMVPSSKDRDATPLDPRFFKDRRFALGSVTTTVVRWYLRYGLSYRDVEELLEERGIHVDNLTIYRWVQRFSPMLTDGPTSSES